MISCCFLLNTVDMLWSESSGETRQFSIIHRLKNRLRGLIKACSVYQIRSVGRNEAAGHGEFSSLIAFDKCSTGFIPMDLTSWYPPWIQFLNCIS